MYIYFGEVINQVLQSQVRINIQMCFLPVKCLKAIVFIGSVCSIAISVALLALTIYVQVEKKSIISSASQSAVSASLIGLYISSIVFLLLGAAGLTGSLKSSSKKDGNNGTCLMGLFSIGVFVFFIIFLAATIFFFVGPETIFGTDCTNGSKTDLVKSLYQTSDEAYQKFCRPGCGCALDPKSELYQILSDPDLGMDLNGPAKKFADCANITNITSTDEDINVLAALEDILKCGGWCSLDKKEEHNPTGNTNGTYYYRFRDINECSSADCFVSLQNCHDAFENFMTGSGRIVGFGCLIAVLVCMLNIIAVCCICYHPTRVGGNRSNFYSRMIEMD